MKSPGGMLTSHRDWHRIVLLTVWNLKPLWETNCQGNTWQFSDSDRLYFTHIKYIQKSHQLQKNSRGQKKISKRKVVTVVKYLVNVTTNMWGYRKKKLCYHFDQSTLFETYGVGFLTTWYLATEIRGRGYPQALKCVFITFKTRCFTYSPLLSEYWSFLFCLFSVEQKWNLQTDAIQ